MFAHGVTWFLLLAAPKTVLELQAKRRRRARTPAGAGARVDRLVKR